MRLSALAVVVLLAGPAAAQQLPEPPPPTEKEKAERKEAAETAAKVGGVGLVVMIVGGAFVYFIPSAVAVLRGHPNAAPIMLVNLLLGCTAIGWIVALVWSFTAKEQRVRVRRRGRDDYDD